MSAAADAAAASVGVSPPAAQPAASSTTTSTAEATDAFAHLPTAPPAVWRAPLVPATPATTSYLYFSAQQLNAQLQQLLLDDNYPHRAMLLKTRDTIDFCKQQLRAFGSVTRKHEYDTARLWTGGTIAAARLWRCSPSFFFFSPSLLAG